MEADKVVYTHLQDKTKYLYIQEPRTSRPGCTCFWFPV